MLTKTQRQPKLLYFKIFDTRTFIISSQIIDSLNTILEHVIDSKHGYEKLVEVTDGSFAHRQAFIARSEERQSLITEFETIDDGEEYLAEQIEDELGKDGLSPDAASLLRKAHASARDGECFAERVESKVA